MLADDTWLTLARHANLMADKLSTKLAAVGLAPVWPVEANLVFIVLPCALDAKLKAAGARYYGRRTTDLKVGAGQTLARLVTFFDTQEGRDRAFRSALQRLLIEQRDAVVPDATGWHSGNFSSLIARGMSTYQRSELLQRKGRMNCHLIFGFRRTLQRNQRGKRIQLKCTASQTVGWSFAVHVTQWAR